MEYGLSELAEIRAKVHAVLNAELDRAIRKHTVDEFMNKYCIVYEDEWVPLEKNRARILVLGALAGNVRDYVAIAKDLNVPKDSIDFINDYDDLKRVDISKFRNSSVYTDIIFGPVPHKMTGMGDTSSLLADMKNNPSEYPRIIEARANDKLKITKTNFEAAIRMSRYYEKLVVEG